MKSRPAAAAILLLGLLPLAAAFGRAHPEEAPHERGPSDASEEAPHERGPPDASGPSFQIRGSKLESFREREDPSAAIRGSKLEPFRLGSIPSAAEAARFADERRAERQ